MSLAFRDILQPTSDLVHNVGHEQECKDYFFYFPKHIMSVSILSLQLLLFSSSGYHVLLELGKIWTAMMIKEFTEEGKTVAYSSCRL